MRECVYDVHVRAIHDVAGGVVVQEHPRARPVNCSDKTDKTRKENNSDQKQLLQIKYPSQFLQAAG